MKSGSTSVFFWLLIVSIQINAQVAPDRYWIQFSNKKNSPYSINNPERFLSERAISRRNRQGVAIDSTDLPVNPVYLDSIKSKGLHIINSSKWLNGCIVETSDTGMLSAALKLGFVKTISLYKPVSKGNGLISEKLDFEINMKNQRSDSGASNQINMLSGDYLHNQNFYGQGILIAVLDAGFYNSNLISSLQPMWQDNKVVATIDFVKDNVGFFETHQHGTIVLSVMAGSDGVNLKGTAPEANYALIRTERQPYEYIIEEYNWVCGAEFADSIGADIINSSLSYTQFDNIFQNHSYSDMDGKTCVSSIGAVLASSKGMVICVSAGNEGNHTWFRIGTPADADQILTVGAVDPDGIIAGFSSRGPSYDGRVKPDVCAQGVDVIAQNQAGYFTKISGTSLSSPLIAGMTACLWQANPSATNIQIMDAIRQSSSQYNSPDSAYGYGIPDFSRADRILKSLMNHELSLSFSFYTYPNPARDLLNLEVFQKEYKRPQQLIIFIMDIIGKSQIEYTDQVIGPVTLMKIDISKLSAGVYNLILKSDNRIYSSSFIKVK